MAKNEELTNRVREALTEIPKVTEKSMFGGIAFMVDDKLCMSVGYNEIMCRIDSAIHNELVKKDGCRTVEMKGRGIKGYVYVSEAVLTTREDLNCWIYISLDFNTRAKASKKKSKK